MISANVDPRMAARQADTQDLVRFKREMDGLKDRLGSPEEKEQKLRRACEKFEAVFISKLWKEMRNTVPKDGLTDRKREEQYLSMFDREFAETMARNGGIGLADMIYEQLGDKLRDASRNTLGGAVNIKPVEAQPISLSDGQAKPIPLPTKGEGMTLEDWGGAHDAASNPEPAAATADASVSSHEGVAMDGRAGLIAGEVQSQPRVMNDVEVKAQLEVLARKLEVERIKQGLLGEATGESGV